MSNIYHVTCTKRVRKQKKYTKLGWDTRIRRYHTNMMDLDQILDLAQSGNSRYRQMTRAGASDFPGFSHHCFYAQVSSLLLRRGLWRPTSSSPAMDLSTCKSSIFNLFSPYIHLLISFLRYRTLSINVEDKSSKATPNAIRQIDVHTLPVESVYQRFSTSPTIGLEYPAVVRLTHIFGKNVISPPKTQYWKKFLNYIFGGFNFLMWIAFIVTIVSLLPSTKIADVNPPFPAFLQASWGT